MNRIFVSDEVIQKSSPRLFKEKIMKSRAIAMLAMVALLVSGVVLAEKADKKINVKKAKCPISGKPAKILQASLQHMYSYPW